MPKRAANTEKNTNSTTTSLGLLEKMLQLIKKYGAWNILKAILLLGTFFAAIYGVAHFDEFLHKAIEKENTERGAYHDKIMKKRTEIKPQIDLILQNVMNETHADRVFVIEMHNGTNNLSGLPFVYCEMTYEKCQKNVEHVDDEYGSIVLSRYSLPYYMTQNTIYMGTVDELEEYDSKLAYRMRANGTGYICVSNMYGVQDYLGYVGIGYKEESTPASPDTLRTAIYKLSQKVSTLLDATVLED